MQWYQDVSPKQDRKNIRHAGIFLLKEKYSIFFLPEVLK